MVTENVDIKWLKPDDWEIFRNLRLEAISEDQSAFGTSFEEDRAQPEEIWRERIVNTLFAFVDGVPAGLVGHVRQPRIKQRHIVHVVGFYVKPEYRGMGIGNQLLKVMMDKIRSYPGVTKVSLGVNTPQLAALKIYQNFGFEIVGELKREFKVGDTYYDMLLMDLFL